MVLPFLQYLLLSLLLAYLLMPIQNRLGKRINPNLAAGSIVFVAMVALIIPLIYVLRTAVIELASLVRAARAGEITLEQPEEQIEEFTGTDINLTNQIQKVFEEVQVGDFLQMVDTLVHLTIGLGLTVFLLYYFLKDGDKFAHWFRHTVPLSGDVLDHIYTESDRLMKAILVGHVLSRWYRGCWRELVCSLLASQMRSCGQLS